MKYESIGNRTLLNKAISVAAPARVTAEPKPIALGDLWRRAHTWWVRTLRLRLRQPRRLRLCETLPLGERRFVAVVEFERSRFLLGGTSASLVLLARLGKAPGETQGNVQQELQSADDTQATDRPTGILRESLD